MNDIEQIKEMARTIFESRVAIDGIDLAFAAVHGADMEDSHFMRIAGHLYRNGYRKTFTSEFASDTQKAFKEGYEKARSEVAAEIIAEIDRMCIDTFGHFNHIAFALLKKKYTEEWK